VHHELVHGRSQELQDRISWNLVELWSTIPPISIKQTITSPLKSLKTNKTSTYDVGNPGPGLGYAQICDEVKPVNVIETLPLLIIGSLTVIQIKLICNLNIAYFIRNPRTRWKSGNKNKIEILQQKKNLTQQDFFGSVAFGQTNYIFILALCITKLKQYLQILFLL
jgi:hypothetical protein